MSAKEKFFAASDRIYELKTKKGLVGLTSSEDLELRNLEAKLMQHYSDWKD